MLSRFAFLLHYRALQHCIDSDFVYTQEDANYIWHFLKPYVLVIHEPTGRGYYLNRGYDFIISVKNPPIPGKPEEEVPTDLTRIIEHETTRNHQAASFTTPKWASKLPSSEFTSYWLY